MRSHPHNPQAVRMLPHHVKAAGSDRSGGTQNGYGGKPGQSKVFPHE
jgi:hypothetical protein